MRYGHLTKSSKSFVSGLLLVLCYVLFLLYGMLGCASPPIGIDVNHQWFQDAAEKPFMDAHKKFVSGFPLLRVSCHPEWPGHHEAMMAWLSGYHGRVIFSLGSEVNGPYWKLLTDARPNDYFLIGNEPNRNDLDPRQVAGVYILFKKMFPERTLIGPALGHTAEGSIK